MKQGLKKLRVGLLITIMIMPHTPMQITVNANQGEMEIPTTEMQQDNTQQVNESLESSENTKQTTYSITPGVAGKIIDGLHTYSYDENGVLTKYDGPGGNIVIPNGISAIADATRVSSCDPWGCGSGLQGVLDRKSIGNVVFPASLKTIGSNAFANNHLRYVSFPNGITEIGDSAFSENLINDVTFPGSLVKIGYSAFSGNQLWRMQLPYGTTSIGAAAFHNNLLESVELPDSITFIGNNAFRMNNLQSIRIPSGVTEIAARAFEDNNLISIQFNSNLVEIGEYAFSNNKLSSLSLGDSVTTVGEGAFSQNEIKSISLPETLNYIGPTAFHDNLIADVELPREIKHVGDAAFNINPLTQVIFTGDFPTIGSQWLGIPKNLPQHTKISIKYLEQSQGWPTESNYGLIINGSSGNIHISEDMAPGIVSKNISLPVGTENEASLLRGVSAIDDSKLMIDTEVKVYEHNVDFNKVGDYTVTYISRDIYNQTTMVTNTVTITPNAKPIITSKDLIFKARLATLEDLLVGVSASDTEDGDLSVSIKEHNVDFGKAGTYYVTYTTKDAFNQEVEVTNTVIIESNEVPVIRSKDLTFQAQYGDDSMLLSGVSGNDYEDGSVAVSLKTHNVDFSKAGTYMVTYTTTDSDGNVVEATSKVTIVGEGWYLKPNNKWEYFSSGKRLNGWQSIGGLQYYFENQEMVSDWWLDQRTGAWYFFKGGVMQRGNLVINGKVNIFDTYGVWKGVMIPDGWQLQSNNKWKYYKNNVAVNGWQSIGGLQYLFVNQEMVSDWWLDKNTGAWYFFNGGVMQRKNLVINGKVNIFDTYGVWRGVQQ